MVTNYHKALDEAFEERADSREPIEVEVIHPDIGRMLKILGRGAKVVGREAVQLSKLGIKYSYKGAKVLGYEAARALAIKYGKPKVKRLIEDAYSPDRPTRVFARAKLRTKYPEIYAVCDFSREGPRKRWTRAGRETIR